MTLSALARAPEPNRGAEPAHAMALDKASDIAHNGVVCGILWLSRKGPAVDIPLLDTKLYSPTVRTRRVARQRLYARLDPLLRANLGLVSAPAGYGKTTLVVDWLNHLAERRDIVVPQVTWLSLDESDNDPARFLSYLIAALQSVYTDAARTVQAVLSTEVEFRNP